MDPAQAIPRKRQGFKTSSQFGPSGARRNRDPCPAEDNKQSIGDTWTKKKGRSTGSTGSPRGTGTGPSSARGANRNGRKQPFGKMNSGAWRKDIVPPEEIQPHTKPSVEVGDLMTGTLRMRRTNRVGINVSSVDGSVRLVKPVRLPPRDKDGKLLGPEPRSYWTLLRSDPGKVTKLLRRRYEIKEEGHEGKQKEVGKEEGGVSDKKLKANKGEKRQDWAGRSASSGSWPRHTWGRWC